MPAAPLPPDEAARLRALHGLRVLDTAPEPEFDALVQAAALVCGVPISLISLVDTERQWFKANVGLPGVTETPREVAFCAHAILEEGLLEVNDARLDPRFESNALVTGAPDIRFYAGMPLRLQDGTQAGTLCVIDREPRQLDERQRAALAQLAKAATLALEGRRALLAERGLRESAERGAAMLAHSLDAIIVTGLDGRVTHWNAAAEQLFGHSAAQMLGEPVARLVPAHRQDEENRALQQLRRSGAGQSFETVRLHRDGEAIAVSVSLAPVVDAQGRLTGATQTVRDIRAQARAARALADSEARFRALSDGSPLGVFATDERGLCTYTNARWQAIYGLSLAQSLGEGWSQTLHPEDRQAVFTEWQRCAAAAAEFDMEFRILRGDGVQRLVRSRARASRGTDDLVLGYVGSVEDVTEARATSRQLADERRRLASTLEGTEAGTWEWNVQTGQTRFNARWAAITGRTLEALEPTDAETWNALVHPEDLQRSQALLERHFAGELATYSCEVRLRHVDGHWVWVLDRGRVFTRTPDGRPEWMYGTLADISALKRQEEELRHSEQLLARTGAVAGVGGWELDLATRRLTWSSQTRRIHGVADDFEPALDTAIAFYAPEARPVIQAAVEGALAGGGGWDLELPLLRADGTRIWVRAVGEVERDAGQPVRLVGAFQDITESHRLRRELTEQHELLRVTLQSIGDAVITTDAQARVTWLNPAAERLTGWLAAEAQGRPVGQVFHIVHEETRAPAENPVLACLARGDNAGLPNHTVLVARNGDEYGIEDSAAPIRSDDGELLGVVLVFHDVTEQRRLSGEMSYRATHDALTGLVNRTEFETRLRRLLVRTHEDRSANALLYIDLDQFKLVNDACGHSAGDQLLQQVSRLLAETVRARDTLARLGGDEFGVLLEHCTTEQAQRVAQLICERMDDFRFIHSERRFRIGASIGLVPVDARWATMASVMQAADAACYAAKEAGRNRVHAWFDTDQTIRARHGEMQWASRLEQALDEDRFELFAQRIESLGEPLQGLHAEVLLRLRERDGQLVAPGAFLPAAERFNLASRIDRWVLRQVIARLQALPAQAAPQLLCVNLSGQSIGDRAFHHQAIDMLRHAGGAVCGRLCLELTETVAVTNMADAAVFIEQARALGVRIALDDFGAGASSFGYLKNLRIDLLKIDGQFIKDLLDDPLDDAAVRGFVEVARVLGVQTVAEFVDRPEILARVRAMGVHFAQGYLLHRPEPLQALLPRPSAAPR